MISVSLESLLFHYYYYSILSKYCRCKCKPTRSGNSQSRGKFSIHPFPTLETRNHFIDVCNPKNIRVGCIRKVPTGKKTFRKVVHWNFKYPIRSHVFTRSTHPEPSKNNVTFPLAHYCLTLTLLTPTSLNQPVRSTHYPSSDPKQVQSMIKVH